MNNLTTWLLCRILISFISFTLIFILDVYVLDFFRDDTLTLYSKAMFLFSWFIISLWETWFIFFGIKNEKDTELAEKQFKDGNNDYYKGNSFYEFYCSPTGSRIIFIMYVFVILVLYFAFAKLV